jgi:tetratricopeptide (TPR) repeat protein
LRAVRAGLAIRQELARLGLSSSIGVASDLAVCMPIGGPQRRHYWAIGRCMHVAARLMQAAEGALLCTEDVAVRVRRSVSLSPERTRSLKGVRWPVQAFRVGNASRTDEPVDLLFGREDEQAVLDRCLRAFEEERGTVLWMVGEAGLGKTSLVQYLRRAAAEQGIDCLLGGAGSVEISVAYAAWRPVFARLLEGLLAPGVSQRERQSGIGAIRHPQLAPLVNAVAPGFLDETSLVQHLAGQARADSTLTVLSEIIESHATNRFVLVLEDCHWMDSASWHLALRVAQDHPRAFIVLTSRPTPDVPEMGALKRLPRFVEMRLPPLRAGAIGSLVESLLEGQPANRELVDEIVQCSVGNPLFAREYALLLSTHALQRDFRSTSSQRVRVEGRGGATASAASEPVPVTLQTLIASRLDALSPSEDVALKAASVIGDRFDADLLARFCPTDRAGVAPDATLARLVERQLIVQAGERTYAFQHALIREVTYEQLTAEQRRDLHRRVAETIERENRGELRPHLAALAYHWSHADVASATIRYSDQAASQALGAGAFEEADRLLRRCVDLAKEDGLDVPSADRIRWLRQVADARNGMGHLEARRAAAHHALRLAGLSRPHTTVGGIAQAIAHVCRLKARQLFPRRTRQPMDDPACLLDIARAYRHSAEVCYFNNDWRGMMCDSMNAVACASFLKPSAVLVGASTELGGVVSVAGFRRLGERMLQKAIALAEAADDQAAQAYAHMISCLYSVGMGDWASAEKSVARCQQLCEPMDDRVNWTNAQAVRFWMSYYRSHDAAAYDAACHLRDRATETGNRQHQAWALRCLALCALRRDDPREATEYLGAALRCLGETAALNERVPTLGILALAQLTSGDHWLARATANDGLSQIINVARPIGHGTLAGYSALVTVALHFWREERSPEWRRAVQMCLRVLRRYRTSFPIGEPRYELHRGDYQRLSGFVRAARRSYRRGEAAATRLGMPWDRQRCQEALRNVTG